MDWKFYGLDYLKLTSRTLTGDGFPDLVVKIIDGGIYPQGNTIARLTGQLFDGTLIEGTDLICVTP